MSNSFKIFSLVVAVMVWGGVWADVKVSGRIDRSTEIYAGDKFSFELVIEGSDSPGQVDTGALEPFSPVSAGTSQSTQIINNHVTRSFVMTYGLTVSKPGKYTIDPVRVTINGRDYFSDEVTFLAVEPDETEKMGFELRLSTERCYVGEPVILTARWYIMSNIRNASFNVPLFTMDQDFYFEDITSETESMAQSQHQIHGKNVLLSETRQEYKGSPAAVIEFQKVLIPAEPVSLKFRRQVSARI